MHAAHAPDATVAPTADDALPAAAVVADGQADLDALLASVTAGLRAAGRQVRGLLMTYPEGELGRNDCSARMVLVDLHRGESFQVSQPLGSDSRACRADPQGFARASQVLRDALAEAPDLVVVNRFGSLEAEGGGFRAELLALMSQGVPLLTAVKPAHLPAWRAFTGGAAELPPDAAAVQRWLQGVLPAPRT